MTNAENPGAVHSNFPSFGLVASVNELGAAVSSVSMKTPSQPRPRPKSVVKISRSPGSASTPSSAIPSMIGNQLGSPR